MELVDGINVMFGNPNDARVEQQPYILLLGRAPVEQLREKCGAGRQKGRSMRIVSWRSRPASAERRNWRAAAAEDGKALYVYLYTKVPVWEPAVDAATGEILQEPVFKKTAMRWRERRRRGR